MYLSSTAGTIVAKPRLLHTFATLNPLSAVRIWLFFSSQLILSHFYRLFFARRHLDMTCVDYSASLHSWHVQ